MADRAAALHVVSYALRTTQTTVGAMHVARELLDALDLHPASSQVERKQSQAVGARKRRTITCRECGQVRPNCGKGLCCNCWTRDYRRRRQSMSDGR